MKLRLLTFAAAVAVVACGTNDKTQVTATGATFVDSADQVFFGVEAPLENNGIKRGTLFADTMYVMNDQSRFDFIQGRVEFNTPLGVPDGSMRADRGRYDRRMQTLEGWGNVVVKGATGSSLKSPHVSYSQLGDSIWSDTTFEFVDEAGRVTTGNRFVTNTSLTRRSCRSDCKVGAQLAIPR